MIDQLSDLELLRLKALEQYHWDEWMPEESKRAVSYTHLTLPTKA